MLLFNLTKDIINDLKDITLELSDVGFEICNIDKIPWNSITIRRQGKSSLPFEYLFLSDIVSFRWCEVKDVVERLVDYMENFGYKSEVQLKTNIGKEDEIEILGTEICYQKDLSNIKQHKKIYNIGIYFSESK